MTEYIKANFVWIAGIATALKWAYEYSAKLKWERSRFLFERVKDFLSRPSTQQVNLILDWSVVDIEIDGEKIRVNEEFLCSALQTHDKKGVFTVSELKVRGIFDEYFDGMTEFLILSEHGLLDKDDFRTFMKYWVNILNGEDSDKSAKLQDCLEQYMLFYEFEDLHRFIQPKKRLRDFFRSVSEMLDI